MRKELWLWLPIFALATVVDSSAYTPKAHTLAIKNAVKICEIEHDFRIKKSSLVAMIDGAREPDAFRISTLQMFKQRIEPNSYGKQRPVATLRIAAQSIHGSPNPTRKIHGQTLEEKMALNESIRLPENILDQNRLPIEVYSYDTNQAVRNKMLINASQFLCVSIAHRDDDQSAKKFGNFLHMIADTYSASHVRRQPPIGEDEKCGTESIDWFFSMDLVSWKRHRPADQNVIDWRFDCLTKHTVALLTLWRDGRKASISDINVVNNAVKPTLQYLCQNVLRIKDQLLSRPAGGASANYSSASGSDNWRVLSEARPDLTIQPVGLTSEKEANAFYENVAKKLRDAGSSVEFSYPPRSMPDLCKLMNAEKPLPKVLQCTQAEINWAQQGSKRVSTMWIPARQLR